MQEQPEEIPGLAAAIAQERERRELAFCDTLLPIGGVWVEQFTAKHWVRLGLIGSPFLGGDRHTPFSRPAVLDFLWIVSPAYTPGASWGKLFFWIRNWGAVRPATARAIYDYLDAAFQDSPGSSAGNTDRRSYYSGVASLCHLFAAEFGWRAVDTMAEPIGRLYQYVNCIRQARDPRAVMFNPSDRVRGKWLHERAQRAQGGN